LNKIFILIAVVFLKNFHAKADFDICSSPVRSDSDRALSINKLRSLPSYFRLGQCKIEIHICQTQKTALPQDKMDLAVGDIYVQDSDGRSIYVPIYDIHQSRGGVELLWDFQNSYFEYRLTDKNMRLTTGRKEVNYLAMDFDEHGRIIDLDVSHYNHDEFQKVLWILNLSKSIHCGPYPDILEQEGYTEARLLNKSRFQ